MSTTIVPDGPTREGRRSLASRLVGRSRPIWEAAAVGVLIGFADTNLADSHGFDLVAYLVGGALLGLRHAGRSCACWPLLGVSLYAVHVVAIACGRQPPYVEENCRFAELGLWVMVPSGLGVMAGAIIRVILASAGRFQRVQGPPVRFLPGGVRDMMVAVACVAVGLGSVHRVVFPPTVYAAGFDEAKLRTIRPGMTGEQVLGILGPPLDREPWPSGKERWAYSQQYTYLSNYDRIWVIFKDGLVEWVAREYWYD